MILLFLDTCYIICINKMIRGLPLITYAPRGVKTFLLRVTCKMGGGGESPDYV